MSCEVLDRQSERETDVNRQPFTTNSLIGLHEIEMKIGCETRGQAWRDIVSGTIGFEPF